MKKKLKPTDYIIIGINLAVILGSLFLVHKISNMPEKIPPAAEQKK